ncbi:hypothetical protein BC629DRAFT_1478587, partial [Irpex lacteus]
SSLTRRGTFISTPTPTEPSPTPLTLYPTQSATNTTIWDGEISMHGVNRSMGVTSLLDGETFPGPRVHRNDRTLRLRKTVLTKTRAPRGLTPFPLSRRPLLFRLPLHLPIATKQPHRHLTPLPSPPPTKCAWPSRNQYSWPRPKALKGKRDGK